MSALAKKILANLALMLGALACALAVGEIAVRLRYKNETVLFPRYHTDYRYGRYTIRGIRAGAEFWHSSVDGSWRFVTNSKGFRNAKEISYAKPANTFRVLSLGDSHTQGFEVHQDNTFSAVLERFLTHRNLPAEVINAGVSGFSNAEELAFLENEGIKYRPDAVVLGFFANDFEDNLKAGLFSLDSNGQLREESYAHVPGVGIQNIIYAIAPIRWLSENSYFYSLLFNRVWDYSKSRLAQRAGESRSPSAAAENAEYAIPTVRIRSTYDIALAAALIERMHRVCKERGIRFIVVDIPVRPARRRFTSSLPPQLVERLSASGIELVGSQKLFQDLDGAVDLHVPHGHNHLSELGHALIGVEIGRRLLQK
jgi:lysophospholipase L1-like esterase